MSISPEESRVMVKFESKVSAIKSNKSIGCDGIACGSCGGIA
jgi:hypothetical protein